MDTVPAYAETRSIRDAVQHRVDTARKIVEYDRRYRTDWSRGYDDGAFVALLEVLHMLDRRLASAPDTEDKGANHGD